MRHNQREGLRQLLTRVLEVFLHLHKRGFLGNTAWSPSVQSFSARLKLLVNPR